MLFAPAVYGNIKCSEAFAIFNCNSLYIGEMLRLDAGASILVSILPLYLSANGQIVLLTVFVFTFGKGW